MSCRWKNGQYSPVELDLELSRLEIRGRRRGQLNSIERARYALYWERLRQLDAGGGEKAKK